jgi:hypothetical protein
MSGGQINGNTAELGGGVYHMGFAFTKSDGTIGDNTAESGKAVYMYVDDDAHRQRDSDAGPEVTMDSRIGGDAGGWE